MTSAKIFADRRLNVPWLAHLSRYGARWSVIYSGAKRPDLFGPTPAGQWVIAEAKGRVRTRQSLIDTMRRQKSAVASVNGFPPVVRIGTTTRFPADELELRVVDPPAKRVGLHFRIDPARWLLRYYAPVVDLVSRRHSDDDRDGYVYGRLDDADLELGIHSAVLAQLLEPPGVDEETPAPARTKQRPASEQVSAPSADPAAEWLDHLTAELAQRSGDRDLGDGVRVRLGDTWADSVDFAL
jgi:hypothetical protein